MSFGCLPAGRQARTMKIVVGEKHNLKVTGSNPVPATKFSLPGEKSKPVYPSGGKRVFFLKGGDGGYEIKVWHCRIRSD